MPDYHFLLVIAIGYITIGYKTTNRRQKKSGIKCQQQWTSRGRMGKCAIRRERPIYLENAQRPDYRQWPKALNQCLSPLASILSSGG